MALLRSFSIKFCFSDNSSLDARLEEPGETLGFLNDLFEGDSVRVEKVLSGDVFGRGLGSRNAEKLLGLGNGDLLNDLFFASLDILFA